MSQGDDMKRYEVASHAMQTGVATEMEHNTKPTEPKHLRVGVNSAMVNQAALARLMIDKGIITADEYHAALADQMEAEVASYEDMLSARLGTKVRLG